jgi:hypothetical protein
MSRVASRIQSPRAPTLTTVAMRSTLPMPRPKVVVSCKVPCPVPAGPAETAHHDHTESTRSRVGCRQAGGASTGRRGLGSPRPVPAGHVARTPARAECGRAKARTLAREYQRRPRPGRPGGIARSPLSPRIVTTMTGPRPSSGVVRPGRPSRISPDGNRAVLRSYHRDGGCRGASV